MLTPFLIVKAFRLGVSDKDVGLVISNAVNSIASGRRLPKYINLMAEILSIVVKRESYRRQRCYCILSLQPKQPGTGYNELPDFPCTGSSK